MSTYAFHPTTPPTDVLARAVWDIRVQFGPRHAWKLAYSLSRAATAGRLPGRTGATVARRVSAAFGFRRWGAEALLQGALLAREVREEVLSNGEVG